MWLESSFNQNVSPEKVVSPLLQPNEEFIIKPNLGYRKIKVTINAVNADAVMTVKVSVKLCVKQTSK